MIIDIEYIKEEYYKGEKIFYDDQDNLANYLFSDNYVKILLSAELDIFDKTDPDSHVLSNSIVTDGKWYWTESLKHYFLKYKISLPTDFIADIRKNEYKCPPLSDTELKYYSISYIQLVLGKES